MYIAGIFKWFDAQERRIRPRIIHTRSYLRIFLGFFALFTEWVTWENCVLSLSHVGVLKGGGGGSKSPPFLANATAPRREPIPTWFPVLTASYFFLPVQDVRYTLRVLHVSLNVRHERTG